MSFLVFSPTPINSFLLWSLPLVRFYVFTYSILFFPVQWFGHVNNPILIDGKWEPGQLFFFKDVINYILLIWVHLSPQKWVRIGSQKHRLRFNKDHFWTANRKDCIPVSFVNQKINSLAVSWDELQKTRLIIHLCSLNCCVEAILPQFLQLSIWATTLIFLWKGFGMWS